MHSMTRTPQKTITQAHTHARDTYNHVAQTAGVAARHARLQFHSQNRNSRFSTRIRTHLLAAIEQSLSFGRHVEAVDEPTPQLFDFCQFAEFVDVHGRSVTVHFAHLNPHASSAVYDSRATSLQSDKPLRRRK